jgi:uracil-DNA glycosylase
MDVTIDSSWKEILKDEFEKDYFIKLADTLREEKESGIKIYPKGSNIFNAFNSTPFNKVKVVIIGQDPYHGEGQAHGISFSVPDGVPLPPSLQNIFKELESDTGKKAPLSGNLSEWAAQGVFLLNAVLTVRAGMAASHSRLGWIQFTDSVISLLSRERDGLIFLLWGNFARSKKELIDTKKHYVLEAAHPSPLARGAFFGCRHFSRTNKILESLGKEQINW